jgi:hypothetical protein
VTDTAQLDDLFAMTPYRWHAPPDIHERLAAAVSPRFETLVDVRVTTYRRAPTPLGRRPWDAAAGPTRGPSADDDAGPTP